MPGIEQRNPKVSVIIPAYNAAGYIAETLDSVFRQTFEDYEVIVVNDGSPDTPELESALAPHRDRIVYHVQENQGRSAARNTAIRLACGEWLALLDSDDIWLPEYLAEQMKFLSRNPLVDYCVADCEMFGDYKKPSFLSGKVSGLRGPVSFEAAVRGEFPEMITTTIVRKSEALKSGLFDTTLHTAEDFEFFVRLIHGGARVDYLHKVLARKRMRPNSYMLHPDRWTIGEIQALKILGQKLSLTSSQHGLLQRQIAQYQAGLALGRGKQCLANSDAKGATLSLREANRHFKDPRITLVLLGLRLAPGLTTRLVSRRNK